MKIIEKLRTRSESYRKRVGVAAAIILTFLVAVGWFTSFGLRTARQSGELKASQEAPGPFSFIKDTFKDFSAPKFPAKKNATGTATSTDSGEGITPIPSSSDTGIDNPAASDASGTASGTTTANMVY